LPFTTRTGVTCPFWRGGVDYFAKTQFRPRAETGAVQKSWEYSALQKGLVSPYNPNTMEKERPTFSSPWRKSVIWPRVCYSVGGGRTVRGIEHVQLERRLLSVVGAVIWKWIITGRPGARRRHSASNPKPYIIRLSTKRIDDPAHVIIRNHLLPYRPETCFLGRSAFLPP